MNQLSVEESLQMLATETKTPVRLYQHPGQTDGGITAQGVLYYLERTRIIESCLSPEDEIVQGWRRDPATYPVNFRGKVICLGRKTDVRGGHESVACLTWMPGLLEEHWYPLESKVGSEFYIARLSSF